MDYLDELEAMNKGDDIGGNGKDGCSNDTPFLKGNKDSCIAHKSFMKGENWVSTNWSFNCGFKTFNCNGEKMVGGYGNFGSGCTATLKLNNLKAHKKLRVMFKWFRIDSWDNEKLYVNIDGKNAYSSPSQ